MKIELDVRNVCRVETDNGDIFELYDTGTCLELTLCKKRNVRQDMKVEYTNLADNIKLRDFHAIRLSHKEG